MDSYKKQFEEFLAKGRITKTRDTFKMRLSWLILAVFLVGCQVQTETQQLDFAEPAQNAEPVQAVKQKHEVSNDLPLPSGGEQTLEMGGTPSNLALPFDSKNMFGGNEFISPFGLVRHNRDKGHGHAGIDIPLSKGTAIYAVADGKIVANAPATDGGDGNNFEGNNVLLLIEEGGKGEGWVFLYEHIILDSGISAGSSVKKRQLIGTSALTRGNNHLGLVYYFNDFKYTKDPVCWVDYLSSMDKNSLLDSWEKIKINPKFLSGWQNAFEDGAYPFRALLDKDRFDAGPQLCYEYGLDVREFT